MKYNSLQHKANQDIANTINKLNAANGIDSRISARDVAAVAAAYAVTSTEPSTAGSTTVKENTKSAKKTYSLQPIGAKMLEKVKEENKKKKEKEKETEQKWYNGYFKKGDALEEGITPGNVAKAYLGSLADIATNLPAGVVGWGENVVDFGATLLGGAADVLGAHDFRDKVTDFVKKDLYDEQAVTKAALKKSASINPLMSVLSTIVKVEDLINKKGADNSVLDYKADSFVQSMGEMSAKIGIAAAVPGVPIADIITGVTAFGQQSETALNEGATVGQAIGSSLVSAGAEVLFEKMSGFTYGGKSFTDGFKKRLAEKISKAGLRTFLSLAGDFASEGLEEVATEFVSKLGTAIYKEENWWDIVSNDEALQSYVDSFVQGSLLGGTFSSVKTISHISAGNEALKDGSADSILEKAKQIAEAEGKNNTGYESFKNIKSAYEQLSQSLEKTNGEISTIRQKALLGELKQETVRAQLMPYIERSAEKIVQNAELVAKKYSEFGFKDANGKPITVTPEAILSGIDVNADRATYIKQLRKALTTNSVLSTLAVIDATGHIKMNTAKFAEATLKGENLADQSDLEYFVEYATEMEKATVGKALGIQDWNTISIDQFRNKVADFALRGKAQSQAKIDSIPTINPEKNANLGAEAQNISQNVTKPLDNEAGVRYAKSNGSKKRNSKTKKYISPLKIGVENNEYLKRQLFKLYSGLDNCIGNGIAIEKDDTIYIVDSSKHNKKMDGHVAVRETLTISDNELRAEEIRRINNDAISNGYVSDELSSRLGLERNNSSKSSSGFETGEKLSADKGQSQNNEGRVSSDNGDRGVQVLTSDKKALPNEKKASSKTKSTQKKAETDISKSMTVIESAAFAKKNVPEYSQLNADDQARVRRLIRQAKANGFTDKQTRAYARVSARSGIDIVIDKESLRYTDKKGRTRYADGLYSPKRNKIFVNPEGSRSPARLLIHELTHALYNDGQSRVILDRGAKNLTEDQKKEIWNKYFPGAEYNENNIIFKDELSSHYTEALLDDDALLEKLCNDNPTLPDKILSFFKKAITGYSDEPNLSREAKKLYKRYKTLFDSFSERNQYGEVKGEGGERFAFGVTQQEIDEYIENAYEKKNTEDYKKYAKASDSLIEEVANEINISGYSHALRDNDIRHIRNSHGENTNEKYPVTKKDLSKIPDIVANYDKVFVFRKNSTQVGLMYVKVSSEGLVYYLEQITTKYGNEKLLVNKQMIKTGIEDIPDISGLKDAITKKESEIEFLADLKARQVYAQSVYQTHSNDSISQNSEKSTENAKKVSTNSGERAALPDTDGTDGLNFAQDEAFDFEGIATQGMPRTTGKSSLTVGELRKVIANNTKQKVYSKQDALSVVGRFTGISGLTQKTRTQIADAVWQILNESPDVQYRRDVAHDMAEFIVAKMITDSKTENPDVIEARERLDYLRTGIGRISFSEGDMSNIRHVLDKKGLKQILGRWGYKNRQGAQRIPLDVFVCDIARQMPSMEYLDDMNPVDAFLELDALYRGAKAEAKDKWISTYLDMPDSEIPNMIKNIEDEIMRAYETEGSQSKFSKMIENKISYYSERAEFWKAEYDKLSGRNRLLGLLMSKAQKMKDLKLGTFANSTQYDSEIFKSSIEKLARIQYRGNLNVGGTRKIISDLHKWYTSDDVKKGVLGYIDESNPGLYVQGVSDMLETLSNGDIGFTKNDLKMLYDVMSYFTNFVENWGKVYRRGRWIEAKPEAERFINTLRENEDLKVGLFSKLAGTTYMQTFGDPMTVARRMDRYESGFYTEMLSELRDAAVDAQVAEMEMRTAYDEFLKKNKNYVEQSTVEKVTYRGVQIPKQQIISLYMTMKRNHSWAGVALNGFEITDIDGKSVRVGGIVSPDTKLSEAKMKKLIEEQSSAIEALLTKTDKEYIAILEQAYNVDARNAKADRDKQRLGFTNVTNDYYYPIRRGNISKNIDTNIMSEIDRVSNSSFNKDTVRGAKQELYIEPADVVFNRHIHAVCQYAYLSPAIEAYNVLYNMDISGNPNKPISVATESANTWNKGNKYFAKLISDIQGIPASSDEGMKALGFIRGSYAKFQLGANPKVWLTQLSSVFASSSMLDADSIARGMSISSKDIDEYCSLAKLRNYDNTAAMAQAVLDSKTKRTISKIGKFSDLLMAPIGKMDRFTVGRLFGACQAQVEKNGGAKVGTDANKIEAGKLLRRVILETQQNSVATERSAAMRSGNEIMRTLTMFTSDSMKVIGRVIDSIGEASTLRARLRTSTDADSKAKLQQQLKEANRKTRKSVGALCLTAVFMASIAQLFRWLYDKEQDEDESVAETMLVDAVGNLFGGLPLFKDAYAKIFEGYDVDNYAYSAINDLLDSALNLFSVAENLLTNKGSAQERNLAIRNLSYSVGQILGIPTRNVYNVFYGLTKRFNPETAYVIDNAFYKKNYQNDLYKAIERDDTEMSSFIMSLLLGERTNENIDEGVFNELLTLSKKGQKVLPKTIPSSITVKGVEYALTDTEQAAIKSIYVKAEKSLKSLFSKAKYKALSDEQKTEVIDFVYDTYYDKALVDTLGIDRGNNSLLAEAVSVDLLALLNIATKGLTSDTDRRGNVISGSKKKKVIAAVNALGVSREQRLLLIASKGYSLTDAEKKRLLNYILKLKTTKEKRIELAELCGFTVRNGKIITKNN